MSSVPHLIKWILDEDGVRAGRCQDIVEVLNSPIFITTYLKLHLQFVVSILLNLETQEGAAIRVEHGR